MMTIGAAGTSGVFQKETDDEQRGQFIICVYTYIYTYLYYINMFFWL